MPSDIFQPQCSKRNCKHFEGIRRRRDNSEATEVPFCPAYPKGIPDRIAYGTNLHLVVQDDQKSRIVYEERDENSTT